MLWRDGKEIEQQQINGSQVEQMWLNGKLIWQGVRSCYGSGAWIDTKPWLDNDGWKDN